MRDDACEQTARTRELNKDNGPIFSYSNNSHMGDQKPLSLKTVNDGCACLRAWSCLQSIPYIKRCLRAALSHPQTPSLTVGGRTAVHSCHVCTCCSPTM